ncbi:MAG: hypothetical protein ABIP35_14640, partial [Ginsengibacter sp.]
KDDWRYNKLLSEYYLEKKQNKEALNIAGSFFKSHPKDYIMGMLYAKTLLLNERFEECSWVLSSINILPFEGATIGRELYREALLMQALNSMKNKNDKKAISLIEESKKFPENLGVGKPYDADLDERLEDWMSYLVYQKSDKNKSQSYLENIVKFSLQKNKVARNLFPENALISAWAIERTSSRDEALRFLDDQLNRDPNNKSILWAKQIFDKESPAFSETESSNMRVIKALLK